MSSSRSYYQERGGRGGRYQPNYNRTPAGAGSSAGGALRRAAPREERYEQRPPLNVGKKVCEEYAFKGRCRFHNECRFSHGLRCIGNKLEAHRDRILNMAIGKTSTGYQMFTTGKDCRLMRWELTAVGGNPPELSNDELSALFPAEATCQSGRGGAGRGGGVSRVRFDVKLGTATPLAGLPSCLYLLEDLLLVAMAGGIIQCFEAKTNTQFGVPGHTKDVNAMLITQSPPNAGGVLVTGDMSGVLNMYRPGLDANGRPAFSPAQTTKAEFPVTRLKHVENTFLLIVGGIGCVGVYDMSTNMWGPVWRCESAEATDSKRIVCLSINKVDSMYLAIFTCGEGLCISSAGTLEGRIQIPIPPHGDMVFSAGWTMDRLVAGYGNGSLMSVDLKTLRSDWNLVAHENQVRQIEAVDDFFVTISTDASIGVWRLSDGSDNRIPPMNNRGGRK